MSQFDIEKFKDALQQLMALKAKPYDHKEWKTNGSLADQCSKILESIKETLSDVSAEWGMADAEIYVSKGASYFPKVPWIGILFEGEKPTDGVYPVIVFHKDGVIVACTESIANPQADFSSRCYTAEEIEKRMTDDGKAILPYVDEHMVRDSITWLSYDDVEAMTADKIKMSLRLAIEERQNYRKDHRIGG